jgi:hypothetical protein
MAASDESLVMTDPFERVVHGSVDKIVMNDTAFVAVSGIAVPAKLAGEEKLLVGRTVVLFELPEKVTPLLDEMGVPDELPEIGTPPVDRMAVPVRLPGKDTPPVEFGSRLGNGGT